MHAEILTPPARAGHDFDWPVCYEAEEFILRHLGAFAARNSFVRQLEERMRDETGTLLSDWVDHVAVSAEEESELRDLGYEEDPLCESSKREKILWHPQALLPRIITGPATAHGGCPSRVALRVDSLTDFMVAHGTSGEPEGEPLSRYRRLVAAHENETTLEIIERRGYRGYSSAKLLPGETGAILKAHELWKTRPRLFAEDAEGYQATHALLARIIALVGKDLACHIIFAEERAYWERRNRAGQVQKHRQDSLGLGWANHDHHTFRCSRQYFLDLMRILARLGFQRRERYYAGAQAGWGAQILEQPVEGLVAFCDVNLEAEETEIDFSREPLAPSKGLGTIGLWVGLHGESFLEAGMHHLECRFDHSLLRQQLAKLNIGTMQPFSDFPFLKQAFTEGEKWPVRRARAERLRQQGLITEKQFQQFVTEGAIGSHLENLQRQGGFKGFNQKSVSAIIQATDPRAYRS